jgi:hypothetical protein
MKLDVEGSEPLVLGGAKRVLSTDRPVILIEINPSNLLRTSGLTVAEFGSFINKFDYCVHGIGPDGNCTGRISIEELSAISTIVNVAMLPNERAETIAAN